MRKQSKIFFAIFISFFISIISNAAKVKTFGEDKNLDIQLESNKLFLAFSCEPADFNISEKQGISNTLKKRHQAELQFAKELEEQRRFLYTDLEVLTNNTSFIMVSGLTTLTGSALLKIGEIGYLIAGTTSVVPFSQFFKNIEFKRKYSGDTTDSANLGHQLSENFSKNIRDRNCDLNLIEKNISLAEQEVLQQISIEGSSFTNRLFAGLPLLEEIKTLWVLSTMRVAVSDIKSKW